MCERKRRMMRAALMAHCAPTYKGDPEGCFLRVVERGAVLHYETRTVGDTIGELDGEVAADLRELGYELDGGWFVDQGIYVARLVRR